MADVTVKPNGDVSANWTTYGGSGDHYTRIDNGVDTSDDTQFIWDNSANSEEMDFEAPSFSGVCTSIQVRFRGRKENGVDDITINFVVKDGEEELGQVDIEITSQSYTTWTGTLSGLSKSVSDLSDLRLQFSHDFEDPAYVSELELVCSCSFFSALETALESITTDNGYNTDVARVYEGPPSIDENLERPNLSFFSPDEQIRNYAFGKTEKTVRVWIHGMVDAEKYDYTNLRNLAKDIETLLYSSSWAYEGWTDISSVQYFFSGVNGDIGIIMMELTITDHYDYGSP